MHLRSFRRTAGLFALLFATALRAGATENGPGLEGKELPVVNDLESGLGSLLGHWLGGGKNLEGSLESVKVIHDGGARLSVRVAYSGFVGSQLSGELQDSRKRPQRFVQSEPRILEEPEGEVDLVFEAREAIDEPIESTYLKLEVGKPGRHVAGLVRSYLLGKRWEGPGGGSDAPLPAAGEIVLEPVPLGDTPTGSGSGTQDPRPERPTFPGGQILTAPGPTRRGNVPVESTNIARYVGPKFDFYAKASGASWSNGSSRLPFGGSPGDRRGFVIPHPNKKLGDGKTYQRVLQTHPQWRRDGEIRGTFTVDVPSDARNLETGLGLLHGASGSDGVTFQVIARQGGRAVLLLNERVSYRQVVQKSVPLRGELKGKRVELELVVLAGRSSGQDWAAWIHPRIQ